MDLEQILEELLRCPPEKLAGLFEKITEHKHPGTLLNKFISSRTLNFWAEENKLLDKWKEKGWRKFSLMELTWLRIIYELRQFGMNFTALQRMKETLLVALPAQDFKKMVKENRDKIEAALPHMATAKDKKLVEFLLRMDEVEMKETQCELLNYIMGCFLFRTPIYLIVDASGDHMFLSERYRHITLRGQESLDFVRKPHISISISDIIGEFILEEKIDSGFIENMFSPEELKIIDIIREERPESLIVKFDKDNKINLIEVVKSKKADLSLRLSDIILKNGYETITIKTQDGKIVSCNSAKKKKSK